MPCKLSGAVGLQSVQGEPLSCVEDADPHGHGRGIDTRVMPLAPEDLEAEEAFVQPDMPWIDHDADVMDVLEQAVRVDQRDEMPDAGAGKSVAVRSQGGDFQEFSVSRAQHVQFVLEHFVHGQSQRAGVPYR